MLRRSRPTESSRRVLVLTVVDQGASSVSNFLLSGLVAHYSGARPLGVFALVMSTYVIAQGLIRAFTSDCLLTRVDEEPHVGRRFESGGFLTAATLGVLMGLAVLVASPFATRDFRVPMVLLAVCLPLLAMQDFARYVGIHRRDPGYAIWLDMAWVVLFVVGFVGLRVAGLTSLPWLFGTWTVAGAVVGAATARRHVARGWGALVRSWWTHERTVGTHFAGQFLVSSMSSYVVFYLLALFVISVATVGIIKLALLALGPATVMTAGLQIGLIGLAATRLRDGTGSALRFLAVAGAGMGAAIVLSAAIVYLAPVGALRSVLGTTWPQARPLIPVGGLAVAAAAVAGAAGVGLRALRAGRQILWVTVGTVPVVVGCPLAGAAIDGAPGYVAGALVANALFAVVSWVVLVRTARAAREPAPGRSRSVEVDRAQQRGAAWAAVDAGAALLDGAGAEQVLDGGEAAPPREVPLLPGLVLAAAAADGMAMARATALGRPPVDRLGAGGASAGGGAVGTPGDGPVAGGLVPDATVAGTAAGIGTFPSGPQRRVRLVALALVAAAAGLALVDLGRVHDPGRSEAVGRSSGTGSADAGRRHGTASPVTGAAGAAVPGGGRSGAPGASGHGGAAAAGSPVSRVVGVPDRAGSAPAGAASPAPVTPAAASPGTAAPPLCSAADLRVSTTASTGQGITIVSTLTATRACTVQPVSAAQLGNCPTQVAVTDGSSVLWPTADRTETCASPLAGPVVAGPVASVSATWDGQVDGPTGAVPVPAGSYTALGSWAVETPSGPVVVQGSEPVSIG